MGRTAAARRRARYTLGGTTITSTDAASTDFGGTLTLANNGTGNCIGFSGQTASSFTLSATGTSTDSGPRAPVNAIQIVGTVTSSPPAAPTGLSASTGSSTSVQLAWVDAATNEAAYLVEYSLSGANSWTACPMLSANSTGYTVTGLGVGTTYDFRVSAMSVGGAASATITQTTLTAYQQWKVNHSLALSLADTATPDGDGIPILLKYATAMAVGSPGVSPVAMSGPGGGPLKLTFQRLSPAPVTYTVEASSDLATWTTIATLAKSSDTWSGTGTVSEPASGSPRTATVIDSVSSTTNRYLRLRVAP
ncbi:MAG: fibronectin type III domain-containing protein [Chthoniobacteraceae bacterium]